MCQQVLSDTHVPRVYGVKRKLRVREETDEEYAEHVQAERQY